MKADFAAVRRRLDGADQDFRALVVEMNAAIKAHGDVVRTVPKAHKTRRNVVVAVVVGVMPIPPHWDRRIAHVLYDTRSALDHLVHELYVASTGKRPTNKVATALQFPICDKKGAWTNATADTPKHISWLHGLNSEFVKIVHRHQPYRSRKTALKRLRQFNDVDKHRRPNVVLFAVRHAYIWAEPLVSCRVIGEVELRPGLLRPLRVGAELAYGLSRPAGIPAKIQYWQLPTAGSRRIVLKQRLHQQHGVPRFSIIPPVWNKAIESPVYAHVWRRARWAIRQARTIVVIGFSFAPTDMYAQSLFRVAFFRSSSSTTTERA